MVSGHRRSQGKPYEYATIDHGVTVVCLSISYLKRNPDGQWGL